jgi:hypothetical protein
MLTTRESLMKLTKSLYERNTKHELSDEIITSGSSKNVLIDIPEGKSGVAITVKVVYNSNASNGVKLELYHSPNGTDIDTDTDDSYNHPFVAGVVKQKTYILPAPHSYINLVITNLDVNYDVVVSLWITFI